MHKPYFSERDCMKTKQVCKRLLAGLLALCVIVGLLPPVTLAADPGPAATKGQTSTGAVTDLPDVTAQVEDHSVMPGYLEAPVALWVNAKYLK